MTSWMCHRWARYWGTPATDLHSLCSTLRALACSSTRKSFNHMTRCPSAMRRAWATGCPNSTKLSTLVITMRHTWLQEDSTLRQWSPPKNHTYLKKESSPKFWICTKGDKTLPWQSWVAIRGRNLETISNMRPIASVDIALKKEPWTMLRDSR